MPPRKTHKSQTPQKQHNKEHQQHLDDPHDKEVVEPVLQTTAAPTSMNEQTTEATISVDQNNLKQTHDDSGVNNNDHHQHRTETTADNQHPQEENTVNSSNHENNLIHQDEHQESPTQHLGYSENYNTLLEESSLKENIPNDDSESSATCPNPSSTDHPNINEKFQSNMPEYEELDIQEEDPSSKRKISITINNTSSSMNNNSEEHDNHSTVVTLQQVDLTSQNDDRTDSATITTIEIKEPPEQESFLKSLWTSKQKWQHFVEKIIINYKSRIEFLKALGNLMYLGSRSRTDVDLTGPASEESETENHLLDILETEKISTVITTIGWYQDYVADKHKLQHKNIQMDERFTYYHKVGQFLRLIECFILLVEIIFKTEYKSKKTGRRNYWNVIILTEIIRAVLKLVAVFKSKTNVPMFLNYTVLPPDEEVVNMPMAQLLPVAPKYNPFEKEKQALEEYREKQKTQAKPKIGTRSGRKIPSSDEMFAVLSRGKSAVPTTTELEKQLGHASQQVYILLAGHDKDMNGTRGKILLYLSEVIYAFKPAVYSFLLAKYGFRSWTPFVVSLLMELFSLYLSKKAVSMIEGEQRDRVIMERPATSGMVIESEYRRRLSSLFNYLYRGPMFELIMNRVFKLILLPILKRVPLLGGSLVGYIEYLIMIQQFYFFCNPSV
ncbi:hypothetical protein C9374_009381 [Naegleria lovaniensis]|uniref:Peroxisomal membrane protein PEX16 n=1 Tax=Naegleria lovaniensis TaxID=51637 RepID=A0AA88KF30_NAELO|nr:Peroxin 16 (Pex16), putative [Naegleria lovaniensis]KAG2377470.1 hypothetical protein C9374_009381 [Naegleria lovaniensis]